MVICYQILASDVADHLPEYATLKAIGYPNRYLSLVVLQEALILAAAGFVLGMPVTLGLYRLAHRASPACRCCMTPARAGLIVVAHGRMCAGVRPAGRPQGEEGGPRRCLLSIGRPMPSLAPRRPARPVLRITGVNHHFGDRRNAHAGALRQHARSHARRDWSS